jgi:hypothetical protein
MLDFAPRFLDQITLDHGPRPLLGQFFLDAEQAVRDRGIYLSLRTDFQELVEVNRANQKTWGTLVPIFHPEMSLLKPDASFWLRGMNDQGEVVCTQGARLFLWDSSTLKDELGSLRVFYSDPSERIAKGEQCIVTAPSASRITGRVAFSGATWVRPDYRGRNMAALLPRISRAYGLTRWRTEYSFSMVEPILIEKGVTAAYGYTTTEPMISFKGGFRGDRDFHLIFKTEHEIVEDCEIYVSEAKWNRVRSTEVLETIGAPPRERQGSSRRS